MEPYDKKQCIQFIFLPHRSPRSIRQEILDNPPKLAPEVLQKLLSEAYNPLSKKLTTLQEEDTEGNTFIHVN